MRSCIAIALILFLSEATFGFGSSSKRVGLDANSGQATRPAPAPWLDTRGVPVPTAIQNFPADAGTAQPRPPTSSILSNRAPTAAPGASADEPRLRSPLAGRYTISRCVTDDHDGVDLAAPLGTPIRAVKGGTVVIARKLRGYGYTVIIDHGNNTHTLYAHMPPRAIQRANIRVGQHVDQDQVIGAVGHSGEAHGNHLHFEVRYQNRVMSPLDEISAIAENSSGGSRCLDGGDGEDHINFESLVNGGRK